TAEGLRPAAPDLGRRDARPRRDERSRLGAPLLRVLPGYALRSDGPAAVHRDWPRALPRGLVLRLHAGLARARARDDLATSVDRPQGLVRAERAHGAAAGLR